MAHDGTGTAVPLSDAEHGIRKIGNKEGVVGDHQDSRLSFESPEGPEEPRLAFRVHVGRGLVQHENAGIGSQRPGDQYAAPLASGKRGIGSIPQFRDIRLFQCGVHGAAILRRVAAPATAKTAHAHDLGHGDRKGGVV